MFYDIFYYIVYIKSYNSNLGILNNKLVFDVKKGILNFSAEFLLS